jgi:hypothetical protein
MQPTSRRLWLSPEQFSSQKVPDCCSRIRFCLGSTHQVDSATSVQKSLVAKSIKMTPHPPYSLEITPMNFFLFPRVKPELAGLSLSQDSFKTSWVGVLQTIAKDEFAKHIWQMYECCYKCIQISDDFLDKS